MEKKVDGRKLNSIEKIIRKILRDVEGALIDEIYAKATASESTTRYLSSLKKAAETGHVKLSITD